MFYSFPVFCVFMYTHCDIGRADYNKPDDDYDDDDDDDK